MHIYIHIYMYVYMYIIHICMYVYMYIYIYSLDDGVQVEILKSQLATQSTPKNDEVADF